MTPASEARRGRLPRSESLLDVRSAEFACKLSVGNVEHDDSPRPRLPLSGHRWRLPRDVSNHEPVEWRRKSGPVGQESNGIAETGAHQ